MSRAPLTLTMLLMVTPPLAGPTMRPHLDKPVAVAFSGHIGTQQALVIRETSLMFGFVGYDIHFESPDGIIEDRFVSRGPAMIVLRDGISIHARSEALAFRWPREDTWPMPLAMGGL